VGGIGLVPYNISFWKTKELDNLRIPVQIIHTDKELKVEFLLGDEINVYGYSEVDLFHGVIDGDDLVVREIGHYGEFSGSNWEMLKELLSKSTGKFVAVQVWEGGDSITRLIVEDGEIIEENMEL
jgi:hypothetical protein